MIAVFQKLPARQGLCCAFRRAALVAQEWQTLDDLYPGILHNVRGKVPVFCHDRSETLERSLPLYDQRTLPTNTTNEVNAAAFPS